MESAHHILASSELKERVIVSAEANTGNPLKGDLERMARRRFQDPTPRRRGDWWTIQVRQDVFVGGKLKRINKRLRLAPATMPDREVRKVVAEYLRPLNQGMQAVGSATNFAHYVEHTYMTVVMLLFAKSTHDRYEGVELHSPHVRRTLVARPHPTLSPAVFSNMATSSLAHESRDKIRDVLSSVLRSAVEYGFLLSNPVENVRMPAERRGKKRNKPYLTPTQLDELLDLIAEPYATMVFVAIYTGLRVSELAGLRWDLHEESITIDERYCRGDWGAPKSESSNATIGVNKCVVERIHRMRILTVEVKAGLAVRKYRVVKSDGPSDLAF